jgi:hypothetical protein
VRPGGQVQAAPPRHDLRRSIRRDDIGQGRDQDETTDHAQPPQRAIAARQPPQGDAKHRAGTILRQRCTRPLLYSDRFDRHALGVCHANHSFPLVLRTANWPRQFGGGAAYSYLAFSS